MRSVLRTACVLAALAAGTAEAEEVVCGKDWISFEPLSAEAFSTKPGLNAYLVRKADIRRASRPKVPLLGVEVGYIMLVPIEGDARRDGEYRVSAEAYRAIRACLLDLPADAP